MADNNLKTGGVETELLAYDTLQFEQIVLLKSGLDFELSKKEDFFVASDLIWYPEAENSGNQIIPDVMVVKRPKSRRHAYRQWEEENVAPLVVFEVTSPTDNFTKLLRKFKFYEVNGVQEFYLFNPENQVIEGWTRKGKELVEVQKMDGFKSPNLDIEFKKNGREMEIFHTNGCKFETYAEINARTQKQSKRRLTESKVRMMVKKLREMGINPDELEK